MRLSVSEPVIAPAADVFAAVTDFDALLDRAVNKGVRIVRVDAPAPVQVGSRWEGEVHFKGLARSGHAVLETLRAPEAVCIAGEADSVQVNLDIRIEAVDSDSSRIRVALDLKPKTIPARVLVQSLRLVKGSLSARFKDRVRGFARQIETASHP